MTAIAIAMSGDPLAHHRPSFLVEEEEEGAAGEEGRYVSDSDDDDDVDRFVFLARQPAPAEAGDDDEEQDAMPPRRGGGGGGGRKRRLREMLLADDPPAAARDARLGLVAPRVASSTGEVSGNEESSPERGDLSDLGKKKKKKRRRHGVEPQVQRAVHGKGSSLGPQHRDVTAEQKTTAAAAAAAAAAAGAPRRFLCNMCGRCFGSHQALGGHVHLGHRKKAKDAIAAAAGHEDVAGGGNGDRGVKLAAVGQEAADGNAAHGEDKAAAGNKTVDFAAHHQDVDTRSFLGRNAGSVNEEMFAGAANHGGHGGDEVVEEAGGHGSLAVAVGRPHGKVHRCDVCGKECLSGQALGGHMRKHRKQSPADVGDKERRRSPELDWIPTQRAAAITGAQPQRQPELGWI